MNLQHSRNHCFIFRLPKDLNSGTYALGNSILSFTERESCQCLSAETPEKFCAFNFIPLKNFAVAWVNVGAWFLSYVLLF